MIVCSITAPDHYATIAEIAMFASTSFVGGIFLRLSNCGQTAVFFDTAAFGMPLSRCKLCCLLIYWISKILEYILKKWRKNLNGATTDFQLKYLYGFAVAQPSVQSDLILWLFYNNYPMILLKLQLHCRPTSFFTSCAKLWSISNA